MSTTEDSATQVAFPAETAANLVEWLEKRHWVGPGCALPAGAPGACSVYADGQVDGHELVAALLRASPLTEAVAALVEAARRDAVSQAAEWLATTGYPIEFTHQSRPRGPLWDALVDTVHRDADGSWHGNDLDRDEVEAWLIDEAGD